MKNELIRIPECQFAAIKADINTEGTYFVEIDGKAIQSKMQLLDRFAEAYDFSTADGTWGKNWDALDDLMEALDWIPQDKHVLAIHSYSKLLYRDKESKAIFGDCLKDWLEFWENEVQDCVLGGSAKEFTVYLID